MRYIVAYQQNDNWHVERNLNEAQMNEFCESLQRKGIAFDIGKIVRSSRQAKSRKPRKGESKLLKLDTMPPRGNPCIVKLRRYTSELA